MKRTPELEPLSRDHHQALAIALTLRRSPAEARAPFAAFWREHGIGHFAIEERLLAPDLLDGDEEWRAGTRRMSSEHAEITALAERFLASDPAAADPATADPAIADAERLGTLLRDHVRFEERELFVLLEQRIDRERLRALGAELERYEQRLGRDC